MASGNKAVLRGVVWARNGGGEKYRLCAWKRAK